MCFDPTVGTSGRKDTNKRLCVVSFVWSIIAGAKRKLIKNSQLCFLYFLLGK